MKVVEQILKNKNNLLLALIIIFGILLRTYNFSDWMRFNNDQVRDALIVDRMFSGEEWPLLGPKAGGTSFNLGPAFYYLQYFSALIFGNNPESLAYPVLFFSILSIPLFYLFLKNIFGEHVGLALTTAYSFSFFAVKYSRFAWNINIVPFFVLAFILLLAKISDENVKNKNLWTIALGLVIGIGVQSHTLLFICFPLILFLFIALNFFERKKIDFKIILAIIFISSFLNFPLIIYDIKSKGENIEFFLKGVSSKTDEQVSFGKRITKNLSCQIHGNSFILSAYGGNGECDIFQKDSKQNFLVRNLNISLSTIFFVGGWVLIFLMGIKEKYFFKNVTFRIVIIYLIVSFIIFTALSGEVSSRLFVVIIFSPFILLGLWMRTMKKIMNKSGTALSLIFIVLLLITNLFVFKNTYFSLNNTHRSNEHYGGISLGELKNISSYIKESTEDNRKIKIFSFTNAGSLEYLLEKSGLDTEVISDDEINKGEIYFSIKRNDFKVNKRKEKSLQRELEKFNELDSKLIGQYTVFKLKTVE